MNYDKLKTELATDPLARGYARMTDAEAAASLNATDTGRTRLVNIPSTELLAWAAGASSGDRPRYLKLEEAAVAHASEQIRAIAKAAVKMIDRDATSLDLSKPDRAAMVGALVAGGVLSPADQISIYALAAEAISRKVELDITDPIDPEHVASARQLIGA